MKKHIEEQTEIPVTPTAEPDMMGMLKKIQQHLVFLEKKIDALMGRSPESSFKGRHFSEHRRPYGNSFHQDRGNFRHHSSGGGFHQGRRPEGGRSFEGQQRSHEGQAPSGNYNRERSFGQPAPSEGERSFRSKGHFPRHRKGPRRPF